MSCEVWKKLAALNCVIAYRCNSQLQQLQCSFTDFTPDILRVTPETSPITNNFASLCFCSGGDRQGKAACKQPADCQPNTGASSGAGDSTADRKEAVRCLAAKVSQITHAHTSEAIIWRFVKRTNLCSCRGTQEYLYWYTVTKWCNSLKHLISGCYRPYWTYKTTHRLHDAPLFNGCYLSWCWAGCRLICS